MYYNYTDWGADRAVRQTTDKMNTSVRECAGDGGGGRVHLEVQTNGKNNYEEM